MNIRDIDPQYVKVHGPHFNNAGPRFKQADNRARKSDYKSRHSRAPHDRRETDAWPNGWKIG